MQQLLVELKNASEDAPQVPCSVSGKLNRELADNNSTQNLHSGKSIQDLRVPEICVENL